MSLRNDPIAAMYSVAHSEAELAQQDTERRLGGRITDLEIRVAALEARLEQS